MNKLILKLMPLTVAFGVFIMQSALAQSVTVSPTGPRDVRTAAYTVAGFYSSAPVVVDGNLTDNVWSATYDATGAAGSGGAGYNGTSFPASQEVKERINNSDSGTDAPAAPPANTFGGSYPSASPSFGTAWNEEYLYIAAVLPSGVVTPTAAEATINGNQVITSAGIEFFFNNGNGRSAADPLSANWPRNYNSTRDMQIAFNHLPAIDGEVVFPTFGTFGVDNYGISLTSTDDYTFAIKRVGTGYVFEGRIKWKKLLTEFVDPATEEYTDASRVPHKTVPGLGFDMSVNFEGSTATTQKGQLMWNQCCYNANWTQSQFFGYLDLSGDIIKAPCPTSITITATSANISTPLQQVSLGATFNSTNVDPTLKWEIAGELNGYKLAKLSSSLVVSPLNNGNLTITATSVCTTTSPVSAPATFVLPISGQVAPTGFNITGASITENWKTSTMSATANPSNAPSDVTWSINPPSNLATINSITGVLRATALGNGSVTVQATSEANGVTSTQSINITNQIVLSCVGINSYTNMSQCQRTLTSTTILGFTTGSKLKPLLQYHDPNLTVAGVVPDDLVSFTGGNSSITLGKSGTDWEMVLGSPSAVISVTAVYLNDPTIRTTVRARVRGSLVESTLGCNLTIPGYFTVKEACETSTEINALSIPSSDVKVYPNPANDEVNVEAVVPSAGMLNIVIANTLGSVVSSTSVSVASGKSFQTINTAGLSAGVYIVKVGLAGGGSTTKKLLIVK